MTKHSQRKQLVILGIKILWETKYIAGLIKQIQYNNRLLSKKSDEGIQQEGMTKRRKTWETKDKNKKCHIPQTGDPVKRALCILKSNKIINLKWFRKLQKIYEFLEKYKRL